MQVYSCNEFFFGFKKFVHVLPQKFFFFKVNENGHLNWNFIQIEYMRITDISEAFSPINV